MLSLSLEKEDSCTDQYLQGSNPNRQIPGSESERLQGLLAHITESIAPLWPLQDFVAVNPFVGLTGGHFLEAQKHLKRLRRAEILLSFPEFSARYQKGDFSREDIANALIETGPFGVDQGSQGGWNPEKIVEAMNSGGQEKKALHPEGYPGTIANAATRVGGFDWSALVVNEISQYCASHFDQGQATWANPWQGMPLFQAWLDQAKIDRTMEKQGCSGFRSFVKELPFDCVSAILAMLKRLDLPDSHWSDFLFSQIYSVVGWASYVKFRQRESSQSGQYNHDLLGLLAIRLAYDVGLAEGLGNLDGGRSKIMELLLNQCRGESFSGSCKELTLRYLLQNALEIGYRRQLLGKIASQNETLNPKDSIAQMVFCIDVRSEVMRRHIEAVSGQVETFGFAGFFGLPIDFLPLGENRTRVQCPVLIQPTLTVREEFDGNDPVKTQMVEKNRTFIRILRRAWKALQAAPSSCFSFVESFGLGYLFKLAGDSLGISQPVGTSRWDGVPAGLKDRLAPGLPWDSAAHENTGKKISMAEGILRNLGLVRDFAPLVVFCGHGSETVNNPYKAGLDCGACGGHSGEPNARVAADLLNDSQVRQGLREKGIEIPENTRFLGAVHNTTTDEIQFFGSNGLTVEQGSELLKLESIIQQAAIQSRAERGLRMHSRGGEDCKRRSRDWSEVRSEWGLAGNAAFIIAPRGRTIGLNLGGRTFLHSYDRAKDPEGKVLELILTAPMVVANWINLQYYGSTVDNFAFGSGNKVIHNVVGHLGVLQGNGGDLMTGLPWQSVHDGQKFQHDPLRLLVVVEAPRTAIKEILDRHPSVRDLANNGWLRLVALENQNCYQWKELGTKQDQGAFSGQVQAQWISLTND